MRNLTNLVVMKLVAVLTLIFFAKALTAQSQLPSMDYIPQSPAAAAYTRYGDIPIDLATGVPKVEIPIYTLTSGSLIVPISVSYHASGIKVDDVSSEIGLGWILHAGGVVTRKILGEYDYNKPANLHYLTSKQISDDWADIPLYTSDREDFALRICGEQYSGKDFYSDRYYYQLADGESGVFRRNFIDSTYVMVPYSACRVRLKSKTQSGYHSLFEITAPDGTAYTFIDPGQIYDKLLPYEIISKDKTDTIKFYTYHEVGSCISYIDNSQWNRSKLEETASGPPEIVSVSGNSTTHKPQDCNIFDVFLDSIISKTTIIKFYYDKDREDWGSRIKSRLRKIKVLSSLTRSLIKEIDFNQSYFGTEGETNARLRLDSIRFLSETQNEKFSFVYNSRNLPDYPSLLGTFSDRYYYDDFWGYYNGIKKSVQTPYPFFSDGGNKFPNEIYAKACILEEIMYPTGGKTVFEYELNKVNPKVYSYITASNKPTDGKVGGLRIKKISSYSDDNSVCTTKEYEYEIDSLIPGNFYEGMFVHQQNVMNFWYDVPAGGTPYLYLTSTHYMNCSAIAYDEFFGKTKPIIYNKVTEYVGENNTNTGKIVYYYESLPVDETADTYNIRFNHPFLHDRGIVTPKLLKKENYKVENVKYSLVQSIINYYSTYKEEEFQTGLCLANGIYYTAYNYNEDLSSYELEIMYIHDLDHADDYLEGIYYDDTKAHTDIDLVTKSEVCDYINDSTVIKTLTQYNYNDRLQLSEKSLINSDGKNIDIVYKYPVNFSGTAVYDSMISRNIISPVIEEIRNNDNVSVQSARTNYTFWNGNYIIEPISFDMKESNESDYKSRIRYKNYDTNGNLLGISKEEDIEYSYLWGYNQTYPVVKGENISNSDLTTQVNSAASSSGLNTQVWISDLDEEKIKWQNFNILIRNYCGSNVMIWTYTYDPLVGMTSSTDPNGVTTYYEYDDLGRLKQLKNDDGEIIQYYDYHFFTSN